MSELWWGDEDNQFYYRGISSTADLPTGRQLLQHLNLWEQKLSRDPPEWEPLSENSGIAREPFDICMILDADLTVIPEDLPKFYDAINMRWADFIHGTRMIYPHENDAMRFTNIAGNIAFSIVFSFILEQRTTDTLCGTKVFWRRDWPIFEEMRTTLKNSDLWGDYNLIFGASRYGLKIAQLPVRYFERLTGITKMNKRIKNGLIMLRVVWHSLWEVKFVN